MEFPTNQLKPNAFKRIVRGVGFYYCWLLRSDLTKDRGGGEEYLYFVEDRLLLFPPNKILWVAFIEACDWCCDVREVFDEF